jgi:adenylate cyclase
LCRNFNTHLRYLNLSGNKRLEIRPERPNRVEGRNSGTHTQLSGFTNLLQLRVLGLMDVTTTFLDKIPEETEDRRVRLSPSEVNGMAYGIADTLGRHDHLSMFDLVQPEFRNRQHEIVFAMFGRAQQFASNNRLSKFLHDNFLTLFMEHLSIPGADEPAAIPSTLRLTFLRLNKYTHDYFAKAAFDSRKMSQVSQSTTTTALRDAAALRGGASGAVIYVVDQSRHLQTSKLLQAGR